MLWLWLRYENELETTKGFVESMSKLAGQNHNNDLTTIIKTLVKSNPNMPIQSAVNAGLLVQSAATDGAKLTSDLKKITQSLGFAQIEVAAIGTCVWAFGDLFV